MSPKPEVQGLKPSFEEIRLSAESRYALSMTQVVDISSRMAKSCVATDWFSAPCGENRRFSTHLSPLTRLIYRRLRRFCPIFILERGRRQIRISAESRYVREGRRGRYISDFGFRISDLPIREGL
jgi:hypothetical protein